MPAISASAPGKVILFGEHAVVYGRPALAVPVTQVRARVVITPLIHAPAGRVDIDAPAVGLSANLASLPEGHPLAAAVRGTLEALNIAAPPAMSVRITSTIPVAGGLGSGAAVSVALIRAVSAFCGRPLADETVCDLAYQMEKIHHGSPSGIDNTVITYQRPVFFVRGQPIETVEVGAPLTLIIGDTGIASPTAVTVGDVRAAWARDPEPFEKVFDEIGQISRGARDALAGGDASLLGQLMNENQALLETLGVSSPELERLNAAARAAGAWGAKLSGGGRGGNMIALAAEDAASTVEAALKAAGAVNTIITRIDRQHPGG